VSELLKTHWSKPYYRVGHIIFIRDMLSWIMANMSGAIMQTTTSRAFIIFLLFELRFVVRIKFRVFFASLIFHLYSSLSLDYSIVKNTAPQKGFCQFDIEEYQKIQRRSIFYLSSLEFFLGKREPPFGRVRGIRLRKSFGG
jgi:hypothetical protein